jgi:hypothetical protein
MNASKKMRPPFEPTAASRSEVMKFKSPQMLVLSVLCSLALITGAAAQAEAPVAGKATLGVAVAETDLIAKGWRASKLIHAGVYNDKDEKIGKIDDFIVTSDGKLSVAVVDVGGFLGLGEHRVAIPVQQFSTVVPKVTLPGATQEALKRLPEFKYAK